MGLLLWDYPTYLDPSLGACVSRSISGFYTFYEAPIYVARALEQQAWEQSASLVPLQEMFLGTKTLKTLNPKHFKKNPKP